MEVIRLSTSKFDPVSEIITVNFDCYVLWKKSMKVLDEFSETHRLQTYSINHMREMLQKSGFRSLAFYSAESLGRLRHADENTFGVLSVSRVA